jgi:hypothetical protein
MNRRTKAQRKKNRRELKKMRDQTVTRSAESSESSLDPEALRNVRTWVHEQGAEWTEDDIEACAWLLTHTEATMVCDLTHPDFARAWYRHQRMRGVPRDKTLSAMAKEFPAGTVDYVLKTEG